MGDKLGLSDLHDIIKPHNIIGFVETMKSDTFGPQIPGYQTYHFARLKNTKMLKETLVVYWY